MAQAEAEVRVILTQSAQAFVSELTFSTLARQPAYTDADFWTARPRPLHIELGEWADVCLLAPLTANTLGKLAVGQADNLLTNTILASTCPVLLAPAMNTDMWQQAAVQRSWQQLQLDSRYHAIGPGAGRLACDRVGPGRMAEPSEMLTFLTSLSYTGGQRDLAGKQLLISTGGTREPIDPVRFIGNPATGRMGIALAQAARHRGAQVTLVHGPLEAELLQQLGGICAIAAPTAAAMAQAMLGHQPQADWVIMAAAVADVRPARVAATKLPKSELPSDLPLEPVPDIVAALATARQPQQLIVGFAAQTGEIVPPAKAKLIRKGLDAIVANPVDRPSSGFGSNQTQAVLIDRAGRQRISPPGSKLELAHRLYDFLRDLA